MSRRLSRFFLMLALVFSTGAMLSVSFDAEARRGGGKSFGRQSSNVTQQRQAATPPAAPSAASRAAAPAAGAAAASTAARSGMSRWLGPIAGIAAGLGIAALLSSLGLSGAFLEFMSSLLLIGLVVFAVLFLVRRLRAGANQQRHAHQGAGASPMQRQASTPVAPQMPAPVQPVADPIATTGPAAAVAQPLDESWFIPGDFDTAAFLSNAKARFIEIQAHWDRGDIAALGDYLTDDLLAEIKPELLQSTDGSTEVVLLNAELLGIEKVEGGHLASVRFSGMLREAANPEAFRFEEVWNLFKADNAGWLLAGIQQIPLDHAS